MEARTLRPMRLLGTALSFALLSTAAARAADLTIGAFGGIFEESLRKCSVQPFTAKTGKTVEIVFGSPVQWLNQIAASPAHPPLDIIFDPAETVPESASRGLVDKLTVDKVPALAQMARPWRPVPARDTSLGLAGRSLSRPVPRRAAYRQRWPQPGS